MGDFWLPSGHECFFVQDIIDLIPSNHGGRIYRNWRLENFKGQLFEDNDELIVSGRSTGNSQQGTASIRGKNLRILWGANIDLWEASYGGAKKGHFFVSRTTVGSVTEASYIFKYRDQLGTCGVLFQRYLSSGSHSGPWPDEAGGILYQKPTPKSEIKIASDSDTPPNLKAIFSTQEDEGGGYVP